MPETIDPRVCVSEIEIVFKPAIPPSRRFQIQSSQDIYDLLIAFWESDTIQLIEQFKVLLMNRNNRVLGIYHLASGGITGTLADIRLAFVAALKAGAVTIAIAHNHPSGNLLPSIADQELTMKFKKVGELLEIVLIDHLIISSEGYFSFADRGAL
jgi:DNA repair protein RadC